MTLPLAPVATERPVTLSAHGDDRIDPYFWLRDDQRTDPDVLAYLQAENRYTAEIMAPLKPLMRRLYRQMRRRQPSEESSLPWTQRGYVYQRHYDKGAEFARYTRYPQSQPDAVTTFFDGEQRAGEAEYYELAAYEISPDNRYLLVSEDWLGRREYQIQICDLLTGTWLNDTLTHCGSDVVWDYQGHGFFYTRLHPETLQPEEVYWHRLGDDVRADRLLFTLQDDTFYLSLDESRSGELLFINLQSTLSSEVWWLPRDMSRQAATCFLPAQQGHEYQIDHFEQCFYVRSNKEGGNFALYRCNIAENAPWVSLVPARQDVLLQQFELFNAALMIEERVAGLTRLRQLTLDGDHVRTVSFDDPAYVCWLGFNPEADSTTVRYGYSSLTTPASTLQLDLLQGEQQLLKRQRIRGRFCSEDYQSQRVHITARDGVQVPVSLVWRRDCFVPGKNPLLLQGYGAYGLSEEPDFSAERLSLLDRGFVVAIAHVRGGEELGRHWYEQGRGRNKLNTFHDFIDVTRGLVASQWGDPRRVFAYGGSAGGLLVAAVLNMAPELYCGAIAAVPFVDVLTTMQDPGLPLTTGEYDEWGNPDVAEDYFYMRQYSPYDHVQAQAYPHLLVLSGLHDSQVQYWEPAKWVARLRANKRDDNWLLLAMDMKTGHGGKAGRYHFLHDVALEYAFLLHLAGVAS